MLLMSGTVMKVTERSYKEKKTGKNKPIFNHHVSVDYGDHMDFEVIASFTDQPLWKPGQELENVSVCPRLFNGQLGFQVVEDQKPIDLDDPF